MFLLSHNQEKNMLLTWDFRRVIRQLSDDVLSLGIDNYLASEQFAAFCRIHGIYEIWTGIRGLSRDKPELYGSEVVDNAFFLLLRHIYSSRNAEFLGFLTDLLADYSGVPLNPSFFLAIQDDLILIGYSRKDVETNFSSWRKRRGEIRSDTVQDVFRVS